MSANLREYFVETRQVVIRNCRVMASSESEARQLVKEGKADLVEIKPVQTHKVSAAWPVADDVRKLRPAPGETP